MSRNWRRSVPLAALAAVGAGCLTIAACSTTNSGGTGGAPTVSASARVTPDPLASLSATEIAAKAIVNLKAASSLTMGGSLVVSGQPFTFTLGIKPGKGCAGSISTGDKGSFKLIVIGKTVYLNPDNAFWKANAGASAAAVIQLVNGRYIKTTTSGSMGQLTQLCDLSQMVNSFKVSAAMTKGKLTTLNGVKVLPLTEGPDGTAWVTDTAKPQLVKIESPKGSKDSTTGVVTFSPGAPVTLTPPSASDVIEGSAVGL